MASADQSSAPSSSEHDLEQHSGTYQSMMDMGFNVGLPVGGAVTMFVALVLMGAGLFLPLFISFLTWLGLLGVLKTFFSH